MNYIKKIRFMLDTLDISIRELAEKIGVSHGTVANWVNGTHAPKGRQLSKIAKAANLSESEFMDDTVSISIPLGIASGATPDVVINKLKEEIAQSTPARWLFLRPFTHVLIEACRQISPTVNPSSLSADQREELEEFYCREIDKRIEVMTEDAAEGNAWREKAIKAEATSEALREEIARLHNTFGKLIAKPKGFEMRPESEAAPEKKAAKG